MDELENNCDLPINEHTEDAWSRIARESVLLRDSASEGISQSVRNLPDNLGQPIVAGIIGATIAVPLALASSRLHFVKPVIGLLGVGSTLTVASDAVKRVSTMGSAMSDYWDHPEHQPSAKQTLSGEIGPLFVDSIGAIGGTRLGNKCGRQMSEALQTTSATCYRRLVDFGRKHGFLKAPNTVPEGYIDIIDDASDIAEDMRWAERARKAESCGWLGAKQSMKWLQKFKGEKE